MLPSHLSLSFSALSTSSHLPSCHTCLPGKEKIVNFCTLSNQPSQEAPISGHNSHINRTVGAPRASGGYKGTGVCLACPSALRLSPVTPFPSGLLRWVFSRENVSSLSTVPSFNPFGALTLSILMVAVHVNESTPFLRSPDSVHHGPAQQRPQAASPDTSLYPDT